MILLFKMVKRTLLIGIIVTLFSFIAITNFQDLVHEKLTIYTDNFPEKIYVQTDKPYYTIGDDIWFTAYLVNGVTHKKSGKSNVIYVELINDKDSIVSTNKLHTNDISVAGEFEIKKEWKSGNYLLRAYTNYMRNSNPDYFFKKEIPIWDIKETDALKKINLNSVSIANKNSITTTSVTERPDLNFYPEGGYLVNGVQSKVGIKVKDYKNRNLQIEGIVTDSENKAISAFKTFEFGLGVLTFTPELNKTYHANIIINGKKEKYELPKGLPQGYTLNLLNNESELILKTSTTNAIGLKNTLLIAHQRGKVVFQKLIESSTDKYTAKLNTRELNSGITHFTLFDSNGKPVCERLVFVDNPDNDVEVALTKNVIIPKTREKVTLELDLKDKKGNPVSGNLSLAINDLGAVQKSYNDDTIKTYLLLNSDLRGQIENPGYFFEKGDDSKRRFLLDLVMLTHGWSRFTWDDILYSPPSVKNKYEPEKGLYISGETQALKERTKRISAATRLTFIKKGASPFQEPMQSDANGKFKYGPYVFYDSISTLIEARIKDFKSDNSKNRKVHISLLKNKYRSPQVSRNNLLKKSIINEATIIKYIEQSQRISKINEEDLKNTQRLNEIIISVKKETAIEKRTKELDSLTDYGSPRRRLDLNDIVGSESFTLSSLLRRIIPGVNIFNDSISIRGSRPGILLDGFSVEFEDVSFMSGADIEFIDYLSGASAPTFSGGANGVIAIYSKTGNGSLKNVKREPGIINFNYPGFYTAREFYSPDYADSFVDNSKQDIRTTLHWEPKIVIKENSKAEITFFTSDSRSDYAIEIEGITDVGVPVYHYSTFEVR